MKRNLAVYTDHLLYDASEKAECLELHVTGSKPWRLKDEFVT
jgi:hypothetical protein